MIETVSKKLIITIGKERYQHSLRVMNTSIKLAKVYGEDMEKTRIAALLHDCGKIPNVKDLLVKASEFDIVLDELMRENTSLIHAPLGAKLAEKVYNINDQYILDAIRYHTTGRENMTLLDKIIYISDYIEPERSFEGLDYIRKLAFTDLDRSLLTSMNNTIKFLIENDELIAVNTINARNYLKIIEINKEVNA